MSYIWNNSIHAWHKQHTIENSLLASNLPHDIILFPYFLSQLNKDKREKRF